jgi:hypothetical protein
MHGDLKFRRKDLQHFNGFVVDPLQCVVLVYVDCCLYVLLVFIDIEMVFLYLDIYFCWSTPGISCLSLYLTLTNVPNFSQFQIPALIAVHVYVVIYLCDSIWSVSESVYVFVIVCLYMYCRWRSSYQERRVGITLTVLSRPNVCDCPKLLYTILLFISKCLLSTLTVPHDLITLALLEMIADLLLSGLIFVTTIYNYK